MPGTIQVSVLELMDSAPDASFSAAREVKLSPLSLKVTMGKKEYQTTGKEDFSFPVMSLRENLRVMMYNGEGNLISQTEIKIMSVVERGLWDDLFPLEGGGTVHLRMQLVLSEEERMKIQEMRLSALKRKHQELLKGGESDVPVAEKVGDPNLHYISERETVEEKNGQPTLRDQGKDGCSPSASTMQDSAGDLKLLIEKEALSTSGLDDEKNKIESASEGAQERYFFAKNNVDHQMPYSKSPIIGSAIEENTSLSEVLEDQLNSTKKKTFRETSSASSVRKMISAFEHCLPEQLGHHSGSSLSDASKIETAGSLKRTSSGESELKTLFRGTLPKSFSAETLSNSNVEDNLKISKPFHHKKQERIHNFNHSVTEGASIQKKDNSLGTDKQEDSKVRETENASLKSLDTSKPQVSTNTNKFQNSFVIGKVTRSVGSSENVITNILSPSVMNLHKDNPFRKNNKSGVQQEGPNQSEGSIAVVNEVKGFAPEEVHKSSATDATTTVKTSEDWLSGNSAQEVKIQGSRENPIDKTKPKVYKPKKDVKVSVNEYQKVISSVPKNENKIAEHDLPKHDPQLINMAQGRKVMSSYSSNDTYIQRTFQQISYLNRSSKDLTCICYRCHLTSELSDHRNSYGSIEVLSIQWEEDLFGTMGTLVPRYLCLTTGSEQLRTLLHSCSICLGSLYKEDFSELDAGEKKKMLQDSSATKIKNLNHESPSGMSNIFGRLIDQGARIIVIIVACGTLLLSVK